MSAEYAANWPQFNGRRQHLHAAMDMLFDHEKTLAAQLIDGLGQLPGVTVQGITQHEALARRVPTVTFTHSDKHPDDLAQQLAARNIFVWSGHNYALGVAKTLGILDTGGGLRVGPVHYNSIAEIEDFLQNLAEILAN